MAEIDINDIATIGEVRDTADYQLPPEAWTIANNMRVRNSGMETLNGWTRTLLGPASSPPLFAPHFAIPIQTNVAIFWLSVSLAKAQAFDGTNYADVTRLAGDYLTTDTWQWNGTLLGGVPILNNGADVPQFWSSISLAQRLQNLTNWPSTLRARVVRAFGPFLVYGNITDNSVNFPHLVRWSHPAVPGSVPVSYDVSDTTKDTGEKDFPDVQSGVLQDLLPLGDSMFVYKSGSTWKGRYIGGRFIFDWGQSAWRNTLGILGTRCVAHTGDGLRHVLATQDDIVWHDGNTVRSVLNLRQRQRLFNELDTENFFTSFMFCNPLNTEMWFCYPGPGATQPDRALIMNYGVGDVWPVTTADGITFRNGTIGELEVPNDEAWDDGEDEWDVDTGPWSELSRRRVILCNPSNGHFFDLDRGGTKDGVAFTGNLQRTALGIMGKKRTGEWINDWVWKKLFSRLWPKVDGPPIQVRIGVQQKVNGPVEWSTAVTYDPAQGLFVDLEPKSGAAVALDFAGPPTWRMDGYQIDIKKLGKFLGV